MGAAFQEIAWDYQTVFTTEIERTGHTEILSPGGNTLRRDAVRTESQERQSQTLMTC
jgi:hypothetical protein